MTAPDLRAALERLVRLTDGWDDMIRGSEWLEAIEQARAALAAPAADGLDVERLIEILDEAEEQGYTGPDYTPRHLAEFIVDALRVPSREPGEEADDIAHAVEGTDR